jgi:hypothetical protein
VRIHAEGGYVGKLGLVAFGKKRPIANRRSGRAAGSGAMIVNAIEISGKGNDTDPSRVQALLGMLLDLWSPDVAGVWLRSRNSFLAGRSPADLLGAGDLGPVESALRAEISGALA